MAFILDETDSLWFLLSWVGNLCFWGPLTSHHFVSHSCRRTSSRTRDALPKNVVFTSQKQKRHQNKHSQTDASSLGYWGLSLPFFFFLISIGVYSCFTVLCQFLLYSKVNQLYVYTYPLFFGFPSHLGHHRALLSGVPCAIQQVLISYLFYTQYQQCVYVHCLF